MPDKPAEQRVGEQNGGGAEQAQLPVAIGRLAQGRFRPHDEQAESQQGRLQNPQCAGQHHGQHACAPQRQQGPRLIPRARGARDLPARAHAQEAEAPVQKRQDRGAQGYGGEVVGAVEMTQQRRVDHAQQGYGEVGEDSGPGDGPYPGVQPPGDRNIWGLCCHSPQSLLVLQQPS